MGKKKKVVDPLFAKGRGYDKVIRTIADEARCPFCPDNFRYHKQPILKRRNGWFLTPSTWPYKNTKHHLLIIGVKHRERLEELTAADWRAITGLAKFAVKKFKIPGGGLIMRFGETAYTGATVCHLHAHLVVPKLKNGARVAKTVEFPIG